MIWDARSELHVTYDARQDVLEARSPSATPDAVRELEPGTTLHYCSQTHQVMGITLRKFLSRFPLMACTLDVEDHGAAVAREYFDAHPVISA